jgi:hypothetical protein
MANFDDPNTSSPDQYLPLPSHPTLDLNPLNHLPQRCQDPLSKAVARSHLETTTTTILQQQRSSCLTKLFYQHLIAKDATQTKAI